MTRPISSAFAAIGLSPIVAISEQIRTLAPQFEAGGETFAYLQRGELADATPRFVTEAVHRALDAGLTRYPKAGGEMIFKEAVIAHLEAEHGIRDLKPEHILCTYGGQEGLQLVFSLLGGGRVLAFGPVWSCVLENIFPYTGYELDLLELTETAGRLDVDFAELERRLPNADVLYLNSPHNPTGKVFSREELLRIHGLCAKHEVRIVSDEAYKDMVYDGGEHVSPLQFGDDQVIGVFTCSKSFAATGFRIGYTVCRDADLIHRLTLGEYTQTAGVVPFIQKAFADAMNNTTERPQWQAALVASLQKRRDLICDTLNPVFGGELYRPEGAFYVFPNLTGLIPEPAAGEDVSAAILQRFLDRGIAVVPGTGFGDARYARHVRLSFSGVSEEVLMSALDRMLDGILFHQRRASA